MSRPLALASIAAFALALAACGDDPSQADDSTATSVDGTTLDDVELIPGESTTTIPRTPEPAVSVPAEIPTELLVTDLRHGTGYAAAVGDTVLVDYVGVRTVDGVEFDSSYERGIPYAFPLGQGRVIAGWDQGLVGIQVGTQRQLDVPTDLAYGDSPPGGSVIQPGDALSFVIEARAVVPAPDPIAAPTDIAFEPSVGADRSWRSSTSSSAPARRSRPVRRRSRTCCSCAVTTRRSCSTPGRTATPCSSSSSTADRHRASSPGSKGMRVGGRRMITMPPDQAFGPGGDPQLGLPANTDLIVVAELFGFVLS